jgi:hypothetical protein
MTAIPKNAQDTRSALVNTLLVIGAGEAQNIDADWQHHYRRLVLVEPLPERAQFLRQTFGENPDVEVLEAAIVPGAKPSDTITLYEYNWPQATSRHQPAELLQLFPGLKTERMWRISALSPQQLIQEISLSPEGEHGLILEAPADEGPILAALVESNAYKRFSCIELRYPVAGLYDTPEDAETMLEALTACGFEIESQDRTDPDWPSIRLIRNRWKIALEEARETIKALEAQLAEQAEALTAAEQLAEDRTKQIATLESRLKEHQQALEQRTTERDQQAKRADELTAKIKQETESRTKAAQLAEDRSRQLSERQQQLERMQQERAELEARQTLLKDELVRAEAQIDLIKDLLLKEGSL